MVCSAHRRMATLGAVFAVGAVVAYAVVSRYVVWRQTPVDYPIYLMAARGFGRGENVYAWGEADYARLAREIGVTGYAPPYVYSPLTALLVAPLLALPYTAGLAVWTLVNAAATLATGWVLARTTRAPGRGLAIALVSWSLVPFVVSLYAGQANPIATLLAATAYAAIVGGFARRQGILAAISLLIKPLAVALPAYLAWRGRWRSLLWSTGSLALVAGVALAAGLPHWVAGSIPVAKGLWGTAYPPAQNLPALALRWLTAHPYGPALADAPEAARAIGLALAGALALATAAVCWPPLRGRRPSPRAEVGLMVAVVLLAVPHTWYHHYTVAVIPLAALLADPEPRSRGWWLALGAGYGAIQIFGPTWHGLVTIVGRTGALPLLDLATLGMLVIWALLARDVRRTRGLEEVSRQPQVGS